MSYLLIIVAGLFCGFLIKVFFDQWLDLPHREEVIQYNPIPDAPKRAASDPDQEEKLRKAKIMYEEFNEMMRYDVNTAYAAKKKGEK